MRAMILAAGRGERMGALTADTPKPLLALDGDTLIERQLHRLAGAGVAEAVVNVSYRGGQIRRALGDGTRYGLRIRYSPEPEPPLGTAGGIVAALPLLGADPFLLVSADVLSDFDVGRLDTAGALGQLVLVPNPAHHPAGDYGLARDGCLSLSAPRLTYAGIALLKPELFAGLEPGPRAWNEVFDPAVAAGRLKGVMHAGLWIDVGTPERLAAARALLAARDPEA